MPSLPWFPFYYKDYWISKKVVKMSHSQKGVYVDLLCLEWDSPDCSLPSKPVELKKLVQWKGSLKEFELVRSCFTPHPDNPKLLHNARLYHEWMKAHKKQEAAKASALVRWQKPAELGPVRKLHERESTAGFETIGSIADKHFKPI